MGKMIKYVIQCDRCFKEMEEVEEFVSEPKVDADGGEVEEEEVQEVKPKVILKVNITLKDGTKLVLDETWNDLCEKCEASIPNYMKKFIPGRGRNNGVEEVEKSEAAK